MRKLKLDVEALEVDSFEVLPARRWNGTVGGHAEDSAYCVPITLPPADGNTAGTCVGPTYCCEPTWGTCIGPTYCCEPTWQCPVIDTNTPATPIVSRAARCTYTE